MNSQRVCSLEDRFLGETGEELPLEFPRPLVSITSANVKKSTQQTSTAGETRKGKNRQSLTTSSSSCENVKVTDEEWSSSDKALVSALRSVSSGSAASGGHWEQDGILISIADRIHMNDDDIQGGTLPFDKFTRKVDRFASELSWLFRKRLEWTTVAAIAPHSFMPEKYDYQLFLKLAKEATSSTSKNSTTSSNSGVKPILLFSEDFMYGRQKRDDEDSRSLPAEADFRSYFYLPEDYREQEYDPKTEMKYFWYPTRGPKHKDHILTLKASREPIAGKLVLCSIALVDQNDKDDIMHRRYLNVSRHFNVKDEHVIPFLWIHTGHTRTSYITASTPPTKPPQILPDFASIAKMAGWSKYSK